MAYVILVGILYIAGFVVSKLADITGVPFYICNFVYGVIIALYAMENWTLLKDVEKMRSEGIVERVEDLGNKDFKKIVAALVARIDALENQNEQLREACRKEKNKRRIVKRSYSDSSMGDLVKNGIDCPKYNQMHSFSL